MFPELVWPEAPTPAATMAMGMLCAQTLNEFVLLLPVTLLEALAVPPPDALASLFAVEELLLPVSVELAVADERLPVAVASATADSSLEVA